MDSKLLNILVCPVTKGPLILDKKKTMSLFPSLRGLLIPFAMVFR